MFVHIVADHQDKISELRQLFGLQYCVTFSLLNSGNRIPQPCDAMIIAADLPTEDNIAALMGIIGENKKLPREGFSSLVKNRDCWKRELMHLARHMPSSVR
jgi:hypothetical protein